jgi:peptidoglycan hydrolase-like protein with peptidoglycan-binding domain
MVRFAIAFSIFATTAFLVSTAAAAETLYARSGATLTDGLFGSIAQFQSALNKSLRECNKPPANPVADGKYGPGTVAAIIAFMSCPAAQDLARDDAAWRGTVTDSLWKKLLPSTPPPTIDDRVQTLVLTYEATDYTRAEWNYCQNKPLYNPSDPQSVCYTNDPRSYLTWGPRGATAGHGREIQAILWLISQRARLDLENAFGGEISNIDRLVGLSPAATEKMLCAVWMDSSRRAHWSAAFANLGKAATTRRTYNEYYRSTHSDGSKIRTFFNLYELIGLNPSEIDYGFFVDRATHSSPPAAARLPALAEQTRVFIAGKDNPNALARLFLSRNIVTGNASQIADRRGRDIAFVLDALDKKGILTRQERNDWEARGRYKASDVGLSDGRAAPGFTPTTIDLSKMPAPTSNDLTASEENVCPDRVLHPVPPRRP